MSGNPPFILKCDSDPNLFAVFTNNVITVVSP